MKAEWISINDKKPEYSTNVLVCRPNKYSGKIDILIANLYKSKEEGTEYGRGNGMGGGYCKTYNDYWVLPAIVLFETITYWMPLPEYPGEPKVEKEPIEPESDAYYNRYKLFERNEKPEGVRITFDCDHHFPELPVNGYVYCVRCKKQFKITTSQKNDQQPDKPSDGKSAEEYYKSECGRFDFGTGKEGFIIARQKDIERFAEEYAQSQAMGVSDKIINANEPLPECVHNQYCDKQTTDMHCMSTTGCNFKE